MSTLKTHNLQSPDAGSVNIVMAPNAGMVVAGLSTYSNQINVGSNIKLGTAGVVTATSFVGSGANLTSLPSQLTLSNNADNRVITGGSGTNLNGESTLTYNGSTLIFADTTGDAYIQYGAHSTIANNFVLGAQGDGTFRLFNGTYASGTERLRITSAGKMGLGTNNPTQYFHVVGNSASIQTEESGGGIVRMQSGGSTGNIGMYSNHDLLLRTNSLERLRINSSGNLKIGNTANRDLGGLSVQRLHIEGTDGGSSAIGLVNNQNSTGQAAIYFSKSRGTSVNSNTIVQEGDPLGSMVFCGADGNDMISIGAQITATVDGTPGSNDMPGRLVFSTTADGAASPTTRVEIKNTGRMQVNLPSSSGSSSVISTEQAIVGTKHVHTVYHNFSSTNSGLDVNNTIPTNSAGTVDIMGGWSNGNGIIFKRFVWCASGDSAISQVFSTAASRYGVSVSISTPTMSISGDYVNFNFTFSDSQGSKMEKLKIHFEYHKQFYV